MEGYRVPKLGEVMALSGYTTEAQTLSILDSLGVFIEMETDDELRVLCPFHGNTQGSAMSINRDNGKFICFNPGCGASGSMVDFIAQHQQCSREKAAAMIDTVIENTGYEISLKSRESTPLMKIPEEQREGWEDAFWANPGAVAYMKGRGFTEETLRFFKVGFSARQGLIVTPVFDWSGNDCIGGVGRGVDTKVFKNVPGTKTKRSLFNINNAKKRDHAIVVESAFDAMRVHQAGFPNVVATLGGIFSDDHVDQISSTFNSVIIMTDDDRDKLIHYESCKKCSKSGKTDCVGHNSGREFGAKIADKVLRAGVIPTWAMLPEYGIIYPEGCKDAGDCTEDQIRKMIYNSVNNFEYKRQTKGD